MSKKRPRRRTNLYGGRVNYLSQTVQGLVIDFGGRYKSIEIRGPVHIREALEMYCECGFTTYGYNHETHQVAVVGWPKPEYV